MVASDRVRKQITRGTLRGVAALSQCADPNPNSEFPVRFYAIFSPHLMPHKMGRPSPRTLLRSSSFLSSPPCGSRVLAAAQCCDEESAGPWREH